MNIIAIPDAMDVLVSDQLLATIPLYTIITINGKPATIAGIALAIKTKSSKYFFIISINHPTPLLSVRTQVVPMWSILVCLAYPCDGELYYLLFDIPSHLFL